MVDLTPNDPNNKKNKTFRKKIQTTNRYAFKKTF